MVTEINTEGEPYLKLMIKSLRNEKRKFNFYRNH